MKVLIIEDEKPAADKLARQLQELDDFIEVVGPLETVKESLEFLRKENFIDLIFMDIQLGDGISFEIFQEIEVKIPIIFTTAFDEYALRAFKVNSIDYLLKPIEINALSTALNKYKRIYQNTSFDSGSINKIYKELLKSYKSRFVIKIGLHYRSIETEDISCFYIVERCVFLRTFAGHKYDVDYSLDQIQQMVDPNKFFRISRNYMVNIKAIEDIHIYSTNRLRLQLTNNKEEDIIVSRDKVSDFKKWLDR